MKSDSKNKAQTLTGVSVEQPTSQLRTKEDSVEERRGNKRSSLDSLTGFFAFEI